MSENSSNCNMPAGKSYQEIKKNKYGTSTNLMRAPSMPSRLAMKHSNVTAKAEETSSSTGEEEVEDEEDNEFSMGRLIRQASLKASDALPLEIQAPKGEASRRKKEFDSQKLERLRPRRILSQLKTQKSLSDLQSKELQRFKDLGLQERRRTEDADDTGRPTEEDMKAQIKFWARAVASNVR